MDRSPQPRGTSASIAGRRDRKRSRTIAALSVAAGVALSTLTGATAAQAARPVPAFEIFWGFNCGAGGTASRVYSYENALEGWVNDTFDSTRFGSQGYGQKIRNNAESIYVSNARVRIITEDAFPAWEEQSYGACYNLPDGVRNKNIQWQTYGIPG
ncbi:hypothetical protein [Clavibacter sp. VKM Ac-2872]|uniref:hypothetical protein n=1 Tax=Clavibacter sp. VKM Ac-2872 TaxID=2783812 RepID=UPI00188C66D9|nr:hypothetical protein [Clavibacter sp. VKM Ac-2872]MBF4625201.1 hypothetical protein [Clavibacter sp. VKM Ac-2872]